jgi:capsule polysaccharide export protein KpsE/RkpR
MAKITDVQAELDKLKVSVEGETDLVQATKTLLEGQNALLLDLKRQLEEAIAGGDPAALDAVVAQMAALTTTNATNAEALAAALLANTPAGPPSPEAAARRNR